MHQRFVPQCVMLTPELTPKMVNIGRPIDRDFRLRFSRFRFRCKDRKNESYNKIDVKSKSRVNPKKAFDFQLSVCMIQSDVCTTNTPERNLCSGSRFFCRQSVQFFVGFVCPTGTPLTCVYSRTPVRMRNMKSYCNQPNVGYRRSCVSSECVCVYVSKLKEKCWLFCRKDKAACAFNRMASS